MFKRVLSLLLLAVLLLLLVPTILPEAGASSALDQSNAGELQKSITPPAISSPFTTHPTVFVVEDDYQIIFATEETGMAWVEIQGVKYEDATAGLMNWSLKNHKIVVPQSVLNDSGSYTICYQSMSNRAAYTPVHGDTISRTYPFYPAPETRDPVFFCISDQHGNTADPEKIAQYKSFDVCVLGGDYVSTAMTENDLTLLLELGGVVTQGTKPVIFARGNHEIRGSMSYRLDEVSGHSKTTGTYYTVTLPGIYGIVLDAGEDKSDSHKDYGGTVDYESFRDVQTQWLKELAASGEWKNYDTRVAFCHVPFTFYASGIFKEAYQEWTRLLNEMGISLLISGHTHTYGLYGADAAEHKSTPNFPVLVMSDNNNASYGYSGSFVTIEDEQIVIENVLPDLTVKETKTIGKQTPAVANDVNIQQKEQAVVSKPATRAAIPAISAPYTTHPTVFAVENTYQIVFATDTTGMAWAEIGGVKYTDSTDGLMNWASKYHKITVPMSVLDAAGEYTVCFQSMTKRAAYGPVHGDTVSRTYPFRSVPQDREPVFLCISDCRGIPAEAQKVAEYKSFDVLVMGGDFIWDNSSEGHIIALLDICGSITTGACPTIYTRGNREVRGACARLLPNVAGFSQSTGSYYTVTMPGIFGIVLDTGEDKADSHSAYGGTVTYEKLRREQTQWLRELASSEEWKDYPIRVAFCHMPFTRMNTAAFKDAFAQWTELLNQMGIQLLITGNNLTYGVYDPSDAGHISDPDFNVLIMSDVDNGSCAYSGTYVTLSKAMASIENVTSDKSLKASATAANAYIAAPPDRILTGRTDYTITDGVTESHVFYNDDSGENQIAGFMTIVSPGAPVTFKASYPGYYKKGSTPESRSASAINLPWGRAKTTAQAAAYEAATGEKVLFATNADFYNTTTFQPYGYMIMEGNVLQTYGIVRKQPYFGVLKDGSYVIREFGTPCGDVAEAVSGCWMVMDGKNVTDTYHHGSYHTTINPMNAIGLKADGTVIAFVADGRQSPYSVGMSVGDLAELFISMGCVNALDLDGGGSATYASVHKGEDKLVLRNSPSDGSERAITNALLMVSTAGTCSHSYTESYVNNKNGTHTVSCSICKDKLTVVHAYENGVCACGEPEIGAEYLYFDFENSESAKRRYYNCAYNYINFDVAQGDPWSVSAWATANNGEQKKQYRIDNGEGVLYADVTEAGNGPWIAPTNAYGVYPWFLENFYNYFPLNYTPTRAEYLQIRFKVTDCEVVEGKTPILYLQYYYEKDGVYANSVNVSSEFSIDGTEYQILTIPLSDAFVQADKIRGFALRFNNIVSSTGGQVAIDYIYMGSKRSLPVQDHLYFDFTNTASAQERYSHKTYGGLNFDLPKNWWYVNSRTTAPSIADGALSFSILPDDATTYQYIHTGQAQFATPLLYLPGDKDYCQIRFKIENAVPFSANGTGNFTLYYGADGQEPPKNYTSKYFNLTEVIDQGYQILTFPLKENFTNAGQIDSLRMCFSQVCSAEGKNATFTVDYLYIGPEENLPVQDHLFFDFGDTDRDRERYDGRMYGGMNFDLPENWWYINSRTTAPSIANGAMRFSILPGDTTTYQYVHTGRAQYAQPLLYFPGETAYCQVRFRVDDAAPISANGLGAFTVYYGADGQEPPKNYTSNYFNLAEVIDQGYQIVTFPLNENFTTAGQIQSLRMCFGGIRSAEGKNAAFTIDYLYIGPENKLPMRDCLYFGFTNTQEDQARYSSKMYGWTNFDSPENWWYVGTRTTAPSIENGALSFSILPDDATAYQYVHSGKTQNARSLQYIPGQQDYCQIRFKIDGAAAASGNGNFTLYYGADGQDAPKNYTKKSFNLTEVVNQGYKILTFPLEKNFASAQQIQAVRICFGGVYSAEGKNATFTVDYLYIGPESGIPTQHSYQAVVTDPTCTEQGFTTHTCTNCGDSYVDSYTDPTGHSYGNWATSKAATCTEKGQERRDCGGCGHYETREVAATGHNYGSVVTAPTCTEQGFTTHTCANCGDSYVDSYVDAHGHNYEITTEGNVETHTCIHCGDSYETVIETEPTEPEPTEPEETENPNAKNGIYLEDGLYYYYVNDQIQYAAGLVFVDGSYYYIRSGGYVAIGSYWCTNTNGITAEGFYIFAEDGKMILTDTTKTGIYLEDGKYYYYIDGEIQFGAGLVMIDGSYYYIRSNGYAAIGSYWVTNTNGITQEGFYIFATDGKMILTDKTKTGIYLEDGLYYYYVEGEIQFGAGLVLVDGSYYYIRSGGYAAIGEYYVSKTNGLLPEGNYTFGEDGKLIL